MNAPSRLQAQGRLCLHDQESGPNRAADTGDGRADFWICLHFPMLALDVFATRDDVPLVLVEEKAGRQVIHAVCNLARQQGVVPGMPLNSAHALCTGLSVFLRDQAAEEKRFMQMARRAEQFTPRVSRYRNDSILLEVSGSARLFGGIAPICRQLHKEFYDVAVMAGAPTSPAAALLARSGRQQLVREKTALKSVLGDIGLVESDLEAKLVGELAKCGLKSLRDLWRLPRSDLARRFGSELVDFLDRVAGVRPQPVARLVPVTRFFQELELPVETTDSQQVLYAARSLAEKADAFLGKRGSVTEKMRFRLWYDRTRCDPDCKHVTFVVRARQADRCARRFVSQLSEMLARTNLVGPVQKMSLLVDQVLPRNGVSADLFAPDCGKPHRDGQDWNELLELIQARLGESRVYGLAAGEDQRPEKAWRYQPVAERKRCYTGTVRRRGVNKRPARPLWLLPEPRKIAAHQPVLPAGETERIESGWWDGGDVRRDYCNAITRGNSRCWVFHNLDDPDDRHRSWYVHGIYG